MPYCAGWPINLYDNFDDGDVEDETARSTQSLNNFAKVEQIGKSLRGES